MSQQVKVSRSTLGRGRPSTSLCLNIDIEKSYFIINLLERRGSVILQKKTNVFIEQLDPMTFVC